MNRFAKLPQPPYYVVIFSSQRTEGDNGYAEAAQRMLELVKAQPGFLGVESTRDASGFGITNSYFRDEQSIRDWKLNTEHTQVRERGRKQWYEHFEVRVAKVERGYGSVKGKQ